MRVVDRNGAGDGLAAGIPVSAGQWFNWVIWFAIIGEFAAWVAVVCVMAVWPRR